MNSPFTNARIRSVDSNPNFYGIETEQRGSPKLIVRGHILSEILRNARRWRNGYESPKTASQEYGSLLDCLALSPMQWPKRYCVTPAEYERDGEKKKWRNDLRISEVSKWWEAHEGLTVVDSELNGGVHAALKVLEADPKIGAMLKSGKPQVWIEADYTDKSTGLVVPVKCLIDLVPAADHPMFGEYLVDLKTTTSASPQRFGRDVFNYNYDLQAAWYLDLYNAAKPDEERIDFVHIVQENFPPYECRMPILGRRFVERGRLRYQYALELYCRCVCSGFWPGYDPVATEWPITEPEDWMLTWERIYPDKPDEEQEEETETTKSETPT